MLCCECIKKIKNVDSKEDDILIIELSKTLSHSELKYFKDSCNQAFKGKKIVILPNIVNAKIGKYTNLTVLKKTCERIIMECDEAINLYKQKKN